MKIVILSDKNEMYFMKIDNPDAKNRFRATMDSFWTAVQAFVKNGVQGDYTPLRTDVTFDIRPMDEIERVLKETDPERIPEEEQLKEGEKPTDIPDAFKGMFGDF